MKLYDMKKIRHITQIDGEPCYRSGLFWETPEAIKGLFPSTWRSADTYECDVCDVQTNEWCFKQVVRNSSWYPVLLCPATVLYAEHARLDAALTRKKGLEEVLSSYSQKEPVREGSFKMVHLSKGPPHVHVVVDLKIVEQLRKRGEDAVKVQHQCVLEEIIVIKELCKPYRNVEGVALGTKIFRYHSGYCKDKLPEFS